MTDAETAEVIEWLTRGLRDRDTAIRDGEDYADPEVFAGEILTAFRGKGWRPTPAKVYAAPKSIPAKPGVSHREELGPLRAQLNALNEAKRHDRETYRDGAA